MKLFLTVLALCASLMGVTSQASAAAFGSSILNVSNVRLQYLSSGSWVDATAAQANITLKSLESSSTATLGVTTVTDSQANLNAAISFVGPSFSTPTEQVGVPLQSYTSSGLGLNTSGNFAIADTNGSGDSIIGGSISVSTLAQLNSLDSVTADAMGNLSALNRFKVKTNFSGDYRIAFDANLLMATTGNGTASSAIEVETNPGDILYNGPELNRSISGNSSVNLTQSFFTGAATLTAGTSTFFTITQTSTVGTVVVPEPSSMVIFGLMSAGSFLAWRRRRV